MNDAFSNCFNSLGKDVVCDPMSDAFQTCIDTQCNKDLYCTTVAFNKLQKECTGQAPPIQTPSEEIKTRCGYRLNNCNDTSDFKSCVYDNFAEYETLDQSFKQAQEDLIQMYCNPQPGPQPGPQPSPPQPGPQPPLPGPQPPQPGPQPSPPQPGPQNIISACNLDCDNITDFQQCVFDKFSKNQQLDKTYQDMETQIVLGKCKKLPPPLNSNGSSKKSNNSTKSPSSTSSSNHTMLFVGVGIGLLIILLLFLFLKK